MANTTKTILEKVHAKTVQVDECRLWTGNVNASGYGVIRFDKKRQRLHRVVFSIVNGNIPPGLVVMHTCDRRNCVNPDHLMLGSVADNTRDMLSKGRGPSRAWERNGNAKLTADQAVAIKQRFKRYSRSDGARAIARDYGVTDAAVHAIVREYCWRGL